MTGGNRRPESPSHHTAHSRLKPRGDSSHNKQERQIESERRGAGKTRLQRLRIGTCCTRHAGGDSAALLAPRSRRRSQTCTYRRIRPGLGTRKARNRGCQTPCHASCDARTATKRIGDIGTTGERLAMTRGNINRACVENSTGKSICSQLLALGLLSLEGVLHGRSSVTWTRRTMNPDPKPHSHRQATSVSRDVDSRECGHRLVTVRTPCWLPGHHPWRCLYHQRMQNSGSVESSTTCATYQSRKKCTFFVCRHLLLRLPWDGSRSFQRDDLGWEAKMWVFNPTLDAALRK